MGKIAELLEKEFMTINCNNCEMGAVDVFCVHCKLEESNWSLSALRALEVEEKIKKIMEEE